VLVGVRWVLDTDDGREVSFEYRLDQAGAAVQTLGRPREKEEVELSPWDGVMGPEIAKRHGMTFGAVPRGGRVVTPRDGAEYLLALLVKYVRNTGYGRIEPISR
jgi:hypothetical protein